MFRHVPNALTGLRLVLSFVFFIMLGFYQYEGRNDPTFLNIALGIYVVAVATDFLDGYLARRWNVEGVFGRIVDPFVDKILVLGTFIFFAGKNFIIPDTAQADVVRTITGVAPGIVVILLARELLITSLRGASESAGHSFAAAFSGKLKMGFQTCTIFAILVYVNYHAWNWRHPYDDIALWVRNFGIWGTVAIALFSGFSYIKRAVALYRQDQPPTPAA